MLAECCVFDKQLQPPITCDLHSLQEQVLSRSKAYLLPKLRYQFAEFLNPSSLKRLSRLSAHPPVSVYGTVSYHLKLRGFSWKRGISQLEERTLLVLGPWNRCQRIFQLTIPTTLNGACTARPSLLRHPIAVAPGAGILTCYPSTTPFGLALGTDSPSAD